MINFVPLKQTRHQLNFCYYFYIPYDNIYSSMLFTVDRPTSHVTVPSVCLVCGWLWSKFTRSLIHKLRKQASMWCTINFTRSVCNQRAVHVCKCCLWIGKRKGFLALFLAVIGFFMFMVILQMYLLQHYAIGKKRASMSSTMHLYILCAGLDTPSPAYVSLHITSHDNQPSSPTYSSSIPSNYSTPLSSPIYSQYTDYLREVYALTPVAAPDKLPFTPSKEFIKLDLVKKEAFTQAEADEFTHLTLRGDVDQILAIKKEIKMESILQPEDRLRLIVVEGAPGIGKSTLALEFCQQWRTRKLLQQFLLVILLRLREDSVRSATSLKDLLYHPDSNFQSQLVEDVIKNLGGGVLFVFDSFDELPTELRVNSFVSNIQRTFQKPQYWSPVDPPHQQSYSRY